MTMADRIIVMDQGRIVQAGRPEDVYDRPQSPFMAVFMGADNSIELDVSPHGRGCEIRIPGTGIEMLWDGQLASGRLDAYFRDDVPRLVEPGHAGAGEIVLPGEIAARAYPGGHYRYSVDVGGRHVSVKDGAYREVGTPVGLSLPVASLHVFAKQEKAE
jgi:ABC-type Fe3+/spermidine/putrescine transport system ATPase subunit